MTIGGLTRAFLLVLATQGGCVLADPAPTLPAAYEQQPFILQQSVTPAVGAVLTEWPTEFVVPVFLADPSRSISYKTFVDYSPLLNPSSTTTPRSLSNVANAEGIASVAFAPARPLGPGCHVITFVVAYQFSNVNVDEPTAAGGDVATWYYQPGGTCNVFDASGLSTDAGDAARDAHEGGT